MAKKNVGTSSSRAAKSAKGSTRNIRIAAATSNTPSAAKATAEKSKKHAPAQAKPQAKPPKKGSTRNISPQNHSASSASHTQRPPHSDHHIEFIARGILLDGSRILLCFNPNKEYYYLPGGHIEFGESAAYALRRELMEECDLPITVGPLVMVDEHSFQTKKRLHHEMNLVFHVEHLPPTGTDSGNRKKPKSADWRDVRSLEPDLEIRWVDLAAAVDLDIRPESAKAFIVSGAGATIDRRDHPNQVEWVSVMHSA